MNKLITIALLALSGLAANAQQTQVLSTNVTVAGTYLLLTSRANISQVSISTSATPGALVELFNCLSVSAPFYGTNYTNASYVSRSSYATNMNASWTNVDGAISTYTNQGIFTYNVTNVAATNILTPAGAWVQAANTIGTYPANIMNDKGIVLRTSTNASIVIYYNKGL